MNLEESTINELKEAMLNEKIMYRSEAPYGSGVRDIVDVMTFEISDSGNTDILEYCAEQYLDGEDKKTIQHFIMGVENGDLSESDVVEMCKGLVQLLNDKTGHNLKYALWLAEKEAVVGYYCQGYEDYDIDAYYTSDVILSDLGYDGILFAYDEMPKPIDELDEAKLLEYTPKVISSFNLPGPTNKTNFDGFDITKAGNNEFSIETDMLPSSEYRDYQLTKGRYPSRTANGNEEDWWTYDNAYIAEVTPQEYFDLCYKYIFKRPSPQLSNYETFDGAVFVNKAMKYAEMMKNGTKFFIPYINFRLEGQEGRHRALAAYLNGYETIPCLIII